MRHKKVSIKHYNTIQSHYKGKWIGIVLEEFKYPMSNKSKYSTGLICLIVLDQNGVPVKNRILKTLNKNWTTKYKPLDTLVYKSWLTLTEYDSPTNRG